MVDISQAGLDNEMLKRGRWKPKPLRRDDSPNEYPAHRLPGIIGQAVQEVADNSQAPVALVVASALSAVSAAVQTHFSVSRNATLNGPASLFFLTVAESGERKTSVDEQFARPIRDWEARQRQEAKRLEAEYQKDFEAWSRQEGPKGEPPERPEVIPKMLRGDDTSEALLKHLSQYAIAAILSNEAGVIFGSHAMKPEQAQRNMAQANTLWDGGPILEGRIERGEMNIESVRVTMGLMVQPKAFQDFLGKNAGMARGIGFLARFLLSQPQTTQGSRFYKDPSPMPGLAAFHNRVTELLQIPALTDELGRLITTHVKFDENAQVTWIEFYNQVEDYIGGDSIYSGIRDVASKAAENVARLACCLHVFTMPDKKLIDRSTMADACALMRWYLDEAVRFGRKAEATEEVRNAELLEAWLVQKSKEAKWEKQEWVMTVNTIRQKGPNALRGGKRIYDALELLKDHGRVRVLPMQGSKSKLVTIAPQVIEEYS